ncbi:anti-phage protein KwaB [Pseudomonas citronellolis]|uniref:anti-phage protein KwaB n=1 Tax=Pseudomonas citronellolis TaxID=53408 RepID=UPI000853E5BE|nr:anti-phage protein KwaB [Pseudomonas humi]
MMTMEALKQNISRVIADGCGAEFYFLLESGEGMQVKKAEIDDAAQEELKNMFVDAISNNILLNDDLTLVELSSADDRKNAVYRYDLEAVPVELQNLKSIIDSDDFEVFSFASDNLNDLEGILILLGNQNIQMALYKHQYPVALLRQNSGFNLIRSKDRFKKLDDDVLKVNAKFEFFKIDGEYYILDLKALERFFGFHDAIKNVATQGIENIQRSGLVENLQAFSDRLDDISFSRKLVRAAGNSPVLNLIPNEDVIRFASTHPALRGRFRFSADGQRFNLKTKKSQGLFLKLLNDDFLQSELTKRYYDSLAKDAIEAEAIAEVAEA